MTSNEENGGPDQGPKKRAPKPVDAALRQRLKDFITVNDIARAHIARELGVSGSLVSLYLNEGEKGGYSGDVEGFELKVRDLLDNYARRKLSGLESVECEVSKSIKMAVEVIRRTNDIGVIIAEAGQGKTRGLELYRKDNPTSVLYHVRQWSKDLKDVEAMMMAAAGKTQREGREKRAVWLVEHFRGTNRPVILDDAHKLTRPALQWFFDFHDETGVPLIFVGIYTLEEKLRDDAQRFSRVGFRHEIRPENPDALIRHMIFECCPDIGPDELVELIGLCEQVAEEHGHFRAVFKQLKLAAELRDSHRKSWVKAFRSAHTKLIRAYPLNK